MHVLPLAKRTQILHLLVEGNSIRSTTRIADVSINTVLRLLEKVGKACYHYQDKNIRNLAIKRVQVDEIWSFVHTKSRNLTKRRKSVAGIGDTWTWVSMCPDTKLIINWEIGERDAPTACAFMRDLARRLANRVQLSSDGHKAYAEAVHWGFKDKIDYAMVSKFYGNDITRGRKTFQGALGMQKIPVMGNPMEEYISTAAVERQNLTMRTQMKRFTRKTNAHSKKIDNHAHAVALHFMFSNYCRIHSSLRITPAMAAGLTDHVWGLEEVIALL